jgi:Ca2+-binding EF-hand superfamily protein
MKDFFYYSMIRSRDENTTKTRKLNGTVPLDELPNLMRAMGYYPTQQEVNNMKAEVRFIQFAETGQYVNSVDLNTFIRLFVNHRPVYGIGKNNIEEAFNSLLGDIKEGGSIMRDELLK